MATNEKTTGSGSEDVESVRPVHDGDLMNNPEANKAGEADELLALTEEELVIEKQLRRKLDWMILPLIVWTYLMNYIDR